MIAVIESASALVASWGPSIVGQATVTLMMTLLAVRLARRSRAAVRHLWLTAGIVALLVLPFAPPLVPSVRVEIAPAPAGPLEHVVVSPFVVGEAADGVDSSETSASLPAPRWRPALTETMAMVWVAGVVVFVLPLVVGLLQLRRLRRSAHPWPEGQRLVQELAGAAGIRRPLDVVRHDRIGAPAVCGFSRPTILFPADADLWPEDELARAAVHEVEHVRRADCAVGAMTRLVCALFWFHPLVWVAWRRLGLEAERACDDAVVARVDGTVYADQLVTLASRMAPSLHHPLLEMASRSHLASRVAALLDERQTRGRAERTTAAGIVLLTASVIMAVSSFELARAAQEFELDVVSVREGGTLQFAFQPGRMVWGNVPLETLVGFAFGLTGGLPREQQIEGWPDRTLPGRRFTVEATYSGTRTPPLAVQRRLVRGILENRFGMRTHVEQREQRVYALRLVKPGMLGSGIREVDYDCTDPETGARRSEDCPRGGDHTDERGIFYRGSGPISVLVARLQLELQDRVVVDQTGLEGFYQWELLRSERSLVPRPISEIYRPLPELLPVQLGMTIEEARAPVDIVVIDAISMPTPN